MLSLGYSFLKLILFQWYDYKSYLAKIIFLRLPFRLFHEKKYDQNISNKDNNVIICAAIMRNYVVKRSAAGSLVLKSYFLCLF